jgi:hypothetical protein
MFFPLDGAQLKLLIADDPQRAKRGGDFIFKQGEHRASLSLNSGDNLANKKAPHHTLKGW